MFSCDYNGWADVPEEEREELEVFEAAHPLFQEAVQVVLLLEPPLGGLLHQIPARRAA
jgi:hypothetical protein